MNCHFFVPGLLDPMPGIGPQDTPSLPNLEAMLARADRESEPVGYPAGLFALFGIDRRDAADLPTAAVSYLADTGDAPSGFVLHADPLQLVPDRDHLLAFDLDQDALDADEAAELLAAFNGHFAGDGLRLEAGSAGRLYLLCDTAPAIRTQPLSAVLGRNIDRYLPAGVDHRWWHGLLNETQMLCHSLALNQQRQTLGRPAPGGLWFSGGGVLPPAGNAPVTRLIGDCSVARGLLALHAEQGEGAKADAKLIVEHAPGKAVMHADAGAWLEGLHEIEGRLAGLLRDCAVLHVHPGNGTVYCWTSRSARRWWRRKRPLADYLEHVSADSDDPVV